MGILRGLEHTSSGGFVSSFAGTPNLAALARSFLRFACGGADMCLCSANTVELARRHSVYPSSVRNPCLPTPDP